MQLLLQSIYYHKYDLTKWVNYMLRSVQDAREAKRKSQTKSHALSSNVFHIRIICKDEYQVYIKNYKNFRFGTFRARSNRRSFVDSIRKIGTWTQKRYVDETKDTMTIWYEDRTLSARSSSRRRCHASSSGGCLLVTKKPSATRGKHLHNPIDRSPGFDCTLTASRNRSRKAR